jgi:hypothetical protein
MAPKKKHPTGNVNAVTRGGKTYDKDLTLFAEELATQHPIFTLEHAKALWDEALDGAKLTVRLTGATKPPSPTCVLELRWTSAGYRRLVWGGCVYWIRRCSSGPAQPWRGITSLLSSLLTPSRHLLQERERETLRYVMSKYDFQDEAREWLSTMTDPPASSSAEFIYIDGFRAHRPPWDESLRVKQVSGAHAPSPNHHFLLPPRANHTVDETPLWGPWPFWEGMLYGPPRLRLAC